MKTTQPLKPYSLVYVRLAYVGMERDTILVVGEIISREMGETVMVRLVPDDPMTMCEVRLDQIRRLDRKPKWIHYARVRPVLFRNNRFPTDMLRYDGCVPVNFEIDQDGYAIPNDGEKDLIVARTTELKRVGFTTGRWASFGWNVEELRTLKISPELKPAK